MPRKGLLVFGILATLWYVAINVVVPLKYPGYDSASQTVSELSSIDAPTRTFWVVLAIVYFLFFIVFGLGVWLSAGTSQALRIVAAVIIFDAILGLFWPPMHRREIIAAGAGTRTDTLHLVWAFVHLVLMLLMIGFGTSVFGKGFRAFSVTIVLIFIIFGILTAMESRGIEANTPTPHLGTWERINIGAYMIWVVAFAIMLMRRNNKLVN